MRRPTLGGVSAAVRDALSRLDRRDAVALAGLVILLIVSVVLGVRSGGFFHSDWGVAAIVVLATTAVVGIVAGGLGGLAGLLAACSWLLLAIWQGVSASWAFEPSAAREAMGLTLMYAAALVLALMALRKVGWLPRVNELVLVAIAIIAALALAARLLPGSVGEDPQGRLSWPIGYWNGLGALLALGLVLAIGVASSRARPVWGRALTAALVPALALALLLTLSRGAILVAGIALVALVLVGRDRLETLATTVAGLALSMPALVYANGKDSIVSLSGEPLPEHAREGRVLLVLLLLAMAGSGAVAVAIGWASARLPERTRALTVRVLGIAAAGALVVVVLVPPPPGGVTGSVASSFEDFRAYEPGAGADEGTISDRLADAAGSGRWQQWEVAVDQWEEARAVGTGAGDYAFTWNERRPIDQAVQNAHSAYLETLADSGVIGLLLLVGPIGVAGVAIAARARRRPDSPSTSREIAVAASATLVIILHAGGDWDWQLPAVMLPAIVLGGSALKAAVLDRDDAPPTPDRSASIGGRLAICWIALVALLVVAGPTISEQQAAAARSDARAGDLEAALQHATDAVEADPSSPDALLLRANLLDSLGRTAAADRDYRAALARSPRSWLILSDWSSSLAARGDRASALTLARRARELNPLEPRPRLQVKSLSSA